MNKHILLVMKWLGDKDSVTQKELNDNRKDAAYAYADDADAAYAAYAYAYAYAADADYAAYTYDYAYAADAADADYADYAYAYADAYAAAAAADAAAAYAEKWVNKYFEYTGENKQDYIDELNKGSKMKTVIDAVNYFNGGWEYKDSLSAYYRSNGGGYWYCGETKNISEHVCTREQFNDCVDMLSGCALELVRWKKSKHDKPVVAKYTQEMCDAKELPPIGSYVELSIYAIDQKCDDFCEGDKVLIGGYANFGGVDVAVYAKGNSTSTSIASGFKPLTPPVELIDGEAYRFTYVNNIKRYHGIYSEKKERFLFIDGHVMSSYCTNIKHLTVKGEE